MFLTVDKEYSAQCPVVANGALLVVNGESMHPQIRYGDWVKAQTGRMVRAGECCVFRLGGALLLHRLIMKKKGRCWLWGDNAGTVETVPASDVVALVSDGRSTLFHGCIAFVSRAALVFRRNDGTVPYRLYIIRRNMVRFLAGIDRILKKIGDGASGTMRRMVMTAVLYR